MKKVKEVSSLVGITRRTLQFYDDEGILTPDRSKENYRVYSEADLEKAWMIVLYRRMDFKLNEVMRKESFTDNENHNIFNKKIQSMNSEIDSLERRIRFVNRIKEYGFPPICLCDSYTGEADYVGCIEVISNVLSMSLREIDTTNIEDIKKIAYPTCINKSFVGWANRIKEEKPALILQLVLFL